MICPHCNGLMKPKTIHRGNCAGLLMGAMLVVAGLFFLLIPVLGWIAGPIVIIFGLFCGGTSSKVWMCPRCRTYLNRV